MTGLRALAAALAALAGIGVFTHLAPAEGQAPAGDRTSQTTQVSRTSQVDRTAQLGAAVTIVSAPQAR